MGKNHQFSDSQSQLSLTSDITTASPQAKGERVKRIRHLANLSREELCANGEINLATLISWEVGRFGGLTQKGALKLIARVAKEGVFCTPDWLLYEIGAGPQVNADYKKIINVEKQQQNEIASENFDEATVIIEELMMFRRLNKSAIDYIIDDDAMLPYFNVGDYVGGTKRTGDKIRFIIGLNCIIQLKDGRMCVRYLQQGSRKNTYNLVGTNLQSKSTAFIIFDTEIYSAAPVIWHRCKEPSAV